MFSVTVGGAHLDSSSGAPATNWRKAVGTMGGRPGHRSRGCPIETNTGGAQRRPCGASGESCGYAVASARSAGLSILPTAFFGSSSSTSMATGRLYFASRSAQSAWSSSTSRRRPGAARRRPRRPRRDVVGPADDGGLEHAVVAVERGLDLLRVDVLAAADDHVLDAVDDPQVAVLVEDADVAGVQPAVDDRLAVSSGRLR